MNATTLDDVRAAAGTSKSQAEGALGPNADPGRLAVGLMAALQGGYLLARTARDVRPMEIALDLALDHVETHLTEPPT